MADIELVIKVPEDYYWNNIKKDIPLYFNLTERNITKILPKGHGRIIDESQITEVYTQTTEAQYFNKIFSMPSRIVISGTNAPTLIEADKAESEG